MKVNARQWEAVEAVGRHVLVSAGAGTGKTRTVVARVLYLLGAEVNGNRLPAEACLTLNDIAAITYTEAAAADLKRKLREELREAGYRDVAAQVDTSRIGTIHAFCLGVLREFALRMERSPGSKVLDEAEASALVSDAAKDALLGALEERNLEGVNELLAERSVSDVERWVAVLARDADRLSQIDGAELGPRERTLAHLAERALVLLRERLDDRGVLDFDSMITLTRDLLRDDPAVRRALRRRVRFLIVDEFQDVDPVQKEIAFLLGEPSLNGTVGTRLMLVGDAKQSVFRFRRADVAVWRTVEREFKGGQGLVVRLDENYRSAQAILGLVEGTVGELLDTPLDGVALADFEVPYERLTPTAERKGTAPSVEVIAIPSGDVGKARRADEVRMIEARAMARRARELVDAGRKPGDIAVLLVGWGAMEVYRAALGAVGLETYALRSEGFYKRRETVDLLLALEVLDDPNDDRALLGFLRSPFVGLKDETLLAIARGGQSPYWRGLDKATVGEQQELDEGRQLLERYVALRDRVPNDELLQGLLDETGYAAHLRLMGPEKRRAEANVRKFLRVLRRMPATTVGEAIRAIRAQRDSDEVREGDAPLLGGAGNAITVTSVHSAKGLEWPVVFWCDLVRGGRGSDTDLLLGRDTMALKPPKDAEGESAAHDELKKTVRAEEAAEHRRLWYVAATRAKERLILSGIPLGEKGRPSADAPSEGLYETLDLGAQAAAGHLRYADRDGVEYEGALYLAESGPVLDAVVPAEGLPSPDGALLPDPFVPIPVAAGRRRHSATELLAFARCQRRHWFRYVVGLKEPQVERTGTEFISAIARGQIVHDVLERLREDAELDQLLEAAIGRWDKEAPPPEGAAGKEYRRHLREEVELVANHPDYRSIADLPTARRELGFIHLQPGGSFTQGAVDLAAMRLDGLVLVDVKTSQMKPAAAQKRAADYGPQRHVYVAAAEAVSGLSVSEFAFQFSRAGVQVAMPVTAASRKAMQTELREAVRAVEGGVRALTTHPWECRYCGYKTAGWCPGTASVIKEV